MRELATVVALCLVACGSHPAASGEVEPETGEVVTPPFAVRGDLSGLLLVWFDEHGAHTAQKRDDIPEAHRDAVRIDSLRLGPDQRLDADHVWIADARQPAANGSYVVRRVSRDAFDARLTAAQRAAEPEVVAENTNPAGDASADVIVYGASWCGACHAVQAYLRSRGVAFVEKDIERDPGAQDEMMRKAQRAGLHPTGIPVIDFRGHILLGFDQGALAQLIAQTAPPPPSGTGGGQPI